MIIALNSILLQNSALSANNETGWNENYLAECCIRLATIHPTQQFIFINDKAPSPGMTAITNILHLQDGTASGGFLRWKYWLYFRLPAILKKHQASLLITAGNCSMRTSITQFLFLPDLDFLNYPVNYPKSLLRYLKTQLPLSLEKAAGIISTNDTEKIQMEKAYALPSSKIKVILPGTPTKQNPEIIDKPILQEKYAEGKEYFFYQYAGGPVAELINLLKAFSLFKKRQRSNMLLLICSNNLPADFFKSLAGYKYRDEVKIFLNLSITELEEVHAAAYAMLYFSEWSEQRPLALTALSRGVPVICRKSPILEELFGEAAVYADPGDVPLLADKMMLLFKDEQLRNNCIALGRHKSLDFNWDNTANLLWAAIT